jgi:ion channel POLLUX/CASTOR
MTKHKNASRRPTLVDRMRYMFDKSMSAGPIALIGWLGLLSLVIIVAASLFLAVARIAPEGGEPRSFIEAFWESLMRTLDSGTMGGDEGWGYRLVMLLVTLAGIFIVSAFIGVLSSGLESKIADLRKGRSRVLESGHTIILNWSSSTVDIVRELSLANLHRKGSRIVILAERDKVEMEDEIALKAPHLRGTKVICRSGDPCDLADLALVNPQAAKSIIVLAPEGDDPDARVIKTILALTNAPDRGGKPYQIAAEIREARNTELAKTVGGAEVQIVLADDLIARILVQSTRQSGLSAVFSELLGFEGSEIYTSKIDHLAGMTFGDAVGVFDKGALIGLATDSGAVQINPVMDTVIRPGDRAVVIADDTSAIHANPKKRPPVDLAALTRPSPVTTAPEHILMLGWNRRGPSIASELSRFVAPGSRLTIAADSPGFADEVAAITGAFPNLDIVAHVKDTTRDATLKALDIAAHHHIIVLGYAESMSAQSADTRTLVTLLQLRKLADARGTYINVVSEMADARNRELAEVTRADDFVVSNQLVSLMLAQASENRYLSAIFNELLNETGSEIYIRPVSDYVTLDRPVSFFTLIEAARQRGEVVFGYKQVVKDRGARNMGGVIINPDKHELRTYTATDAIVVLARS